MLLLILFAFLAGFVTILSPCILPLLPIVLAGSVSNGKRRPIGIVLGFILSFSFFTLFLSEIVKATHISADFLRFFSVVIIFLFGLSLLLPQFQILSEKVFSFLSSKVSLNKTSATGFWSGILLGLSLGLVWTPCVGPIIASVITLAATSSVTGNAVLITVSYAIGTAIPMFAVIVGGKKLLLKVPWLVKNSGNIQKGFGIVMILISAAIFLNFDRKFETYIISQFPQYGAGLTQIENNNAVKNELKNIKGDQNVLQTTINDLGQNVYPTAPELIPGGKWFNTKPLKMQSLRGKVVLVDFWTYTCINCIRTLPYIKSWNDKYKDKGLVIIGVHTPEFEFEKNPDNVSKALKDFGITYPVMQDNNYATWNAYSNEYWPADYLIDKNGKIRDTHFGEGDYDKTESEIQTLLKETGAKVNEKIKNPTYQIETLSPETYLGYNRLGTFVSPEKVLNDKTATYTTPSNVPLNSFAFEGNWSVGPQAAIPSENAELTYHFNAKDVYLVLNSKNGNAKIKVFLDGKEIEPQSSGNDVVSSIVTVSENRLYSLVKLKSAEDHILKLEFLDGNASAFAFTFG